VAGENTVLLQAEEVLKSVGGGLKKLALVPSIVLVQTSSLKRLSCDIYLLSGEPVVIYWYAIDIFSPWQSAGIVKIG